MKIHYFFQSPICDCLTRHKNDGFQTHYRSPHIKSLTPFLLVSMLIPAAGCQSGASSKSLPIYAVIVLLVIAVGINAALSSAFKDLLKGGSANTQTADALTFRMWLLVLQVLLLVVIIMLMLTL